VRCSAWNADPDCGGTTFADAIGRSDRHAGGDTRCDLRGVTSVDARCDSRGDTDADADASTDREADPSTDTEADGPANPDTIVGPGRTKPARHAWLAHRRTGHPDVRHGWPCR
jgi:hypothetical protein